MRKRVEARGWTILSDNEACARKAIDRAGEYDINHLQLSHRIVHKLKHLVDPERAELVNRLVDYAHSKGVREVFCWDHQLNWMGYYPDQFKSGPNGELNLDDPAFWEWFACDYRKSLDLIPGIDGIVLTFIETDERVELQHSIQCPEKHQKIALLINKLAELIVEERGLRLYIRTFIYFPSELDAMLKSLSLITNPEIVVMCKETPHDFIITHPDNFWVVNVPFDVIVEFDCAHEFNGQGVVASVFSQMHNARLRRYKALPNVIGYTARLDRYGDSLILDRPAEINLSGLQRVWSDSQVSDDTVYEEFIAKRYGADSTQHIKRAMEISSDIIFSVYYTLGLPVNTHSRMCFDDAWSYTGLVSARWKADEYVFVPHDVNKRFHCWKDLVNHLAPPKVKCGRGYLAREILWEKIEKGWIDTSEQMNEEYLGYIVSEKKYGIALAQRSMGLIEQAKSISGQGPVFDCLYHTFARTLLSARLFCGSAAVYYGMRVWNRDPSSVSQELRAVINEGVEEVERAGKEILSYSDSGPDASYKWTRDVQVAKEIVRKAREKIAPS